MNRVAHDGSRFVALGIRMHRCLQMQALLVIPWSRIDRTTKPLSKKSILGKAACATSLEPQELPTWREPRGISNAWKRANPANAVLSARPGTEGANEFQPEDPAGLSCMTCIGA